MFNQPQDPQNSQQSQDNSPFFAMEQPVFAEDEHVDLKSSGKVLGLSPMQRAIIMILIFVLTCVAGSLCLLLSGKIVL
jgi:hypothetical protein